ncbi:MAG: hypothetical protein JWO82_1148 [Akkermansiaceae bacterium]|nr:hypothetical protein [Akkermansiaceae bacterium]
MNGPMKGALTAGLCLLAAWTGHGLALRGGKAPGTPAAAAGRPVGAAGLTPTGPPAGSYQADQLIFRRTVARGETADLWRWLQSQENTGSDFLEAVLNELIDRLGAAAVRNSLELPDSHQRWLLSDWLLETFAARDPWEALKIYQEHRNEFGGKWGEDAVAEITWAACAISADKVVEVMAGTCQGEVRHSRGLEYPPGFDFGKVLDYLNHAPAPPMAVPGNLRSAWAAAAPAEAAAWFAADPVRNYADGDLDMAERVQILDGIASSPDPGRSRALASLATLPAADLDHAWQDLTGMGGGAIRVDPQWLDAATVMGWRDQYLTNCLFNTRRYETLDPSWGAVPVADRAGVIESVLERWVKEDPTPVGGKARERWKAGVERQWAGLGK